MANIKVSEMTEATVFDDGDYTMIVQANQNKKISKENILGNIENDILTINNDVSLINTNVSNITGQILWTNPNPNSSFAGQTITLSSNDYDCYEIVFIRTATTQYNYFSGKILKGYTTVIKVMVGEESNSYLQFRWRTITPQSDTSLQISDGTSKIVNQNTTSTVNTSCIPIYVIGYKTGLFNNEGE